MSRFITSLVLKSIGHKPATYMDLVGKIERVKVAVVFVRAPDYGKIQINT